MSKDPEARRMANRKYAERNPEKIREKYRKAKERDPEGFRARAREAGRRFRERHPERGAEVSRRWRESHSEMLKQRRKVWQAKTVYGLTEAEFLALCERDPVCAICGGTNRRGLGIDHDHKTGRVRGRLCIHCNLILQKVERDAGWIDRAVAYLHRGY